MFFNASYHQPSTDGVLISNKTNTPKEKIDEDDYTITHAINSSPTTDSINDTGGFDIDEEGNLELNLNDEPDECCDRECQFESCCDTTNFYVCTIDGVPEFVTCDLDAAKERIQTFCKEFTSHENMNMNIGLIRYKDDYEIELIRNLDFILFSFNYTVHNIIIHETKRLD